MKETVKVHFVGAGPGAEDLITVRGMRLLSEADVVIYAGSLVNPKLLDYAPRAEYVNSATLTLEEVIRRIREAVEQEKTVVRLHTGEPSLYGAVKEQMRELDRLEIGYDSCPGVSACFGAAASMDLEYTLPVSDHYPDAGKNGGSGTGEHTKLCGTWRQYGHLPQHHVADGADGGAYGRRLCRNDSGGHCV